MTESVEIRPYFAQDERYPSLVGVRVGGDEYETAYVSKSELMSVMDENARLRGVIASFVDRSFRMADKMNSLQSENAKLRELLSEVYEDQCDESDRWKYRDCMCELGVEVETE